MEIFRYIFRRNLRYSLIVCVELVIMYVMLNLSFSLIIQISDKSSGIYNSDAMTLFGYLAVAAVALYVFTVAVQYIVGYSDTVRFYRISVALGATEKSLMTAIILNTLSVSGGAWAVGFIVCVILDVREAASAIELRFFTAEGHVTAFCVYVVLTALNLLTDCYIVKKKDLLKELLGGNDDV